MAENRRLLPFIPTVKKRALMRTEPRSRLCRVPRVRSKRGCEWNQVLKLRSIHHCDWVRLTDAIGLTVRLTDAAGLGG